MHQEYLALVKRVLAGKVVTYQDIARHAGNPNGAVSVGDALKRFKHLPDLPWWRVVAAGGHMSPSVPDDQRILLAREGVECQDGGMVDLRRYRWDGP